MKRISPDDLATAAKPSALRQGWLALNDVGIHQYTAKVKVEMMSKRRVTESKLTSFTAVIVAKDARILPQLLDGPRDEEQRLKR
jgi:putative heme degradation protein